MRKLRIILTALVIAITLSGVSFGQKGRDDKRPPKDSPRVVERPKPPPSNNNSGNQSNSNRRGKP